MEGFLHQPNPGVQPTRSIGSCGSNDFETSTSSSTWAYTVPFISAEWKRDESDVRRRHFCACQRPYCFSDAWGSGPAYISGLYGNDNRKSEKGVSSQAAIYLVFSFRHVSISPKRLRYHSLYQGISNYFLNTRKTRQIFSTASDISVFYGLSLAICWSSQDQVGTFHDQFACDLMIHLHPFSLCSSPALHFCEPFHEGFILIF